LIVSAATVIADTLCGETWWILQWSPAASHHTMTLHETATPMSSNDQQLQELQHRVTALEDTVQMLKWTVIGLLAVLFSLLLMPEIIVVVMIVVMIVGTIVGGISAAVWFCGWLWDSPSDRPEAVSSTSAGA
jgi:hypothetical protein